jgi:hypothetical protein
MAPYTRVLLIETVDGPGGTSRSRARLDDPFHGFEVTLDVRGDGVISSAATSHRHPWTTCPGALGSVESVRGPVGGAADQVYAMPRAHTCVHVNDLVWLASQQHEQRRYEVEVTPHGAALIRDGQPLFGWRLADWVIASPGPFEGWHFADARWRACLRSTELDADTREGLRIARRAVAVAMGYYELDWLSFETAADIDWSVMAESCHTFSSTRVRLARRLVDPPDISLFG